MQQHCSTVEDDPKEGDIMEPMTDRNKAGWIIAFTLLGWMFFFLPGGEDINQPAQGEPTQRAWTIWVIINVILLIKVHLLVSREHRAAKRFNRAMQRARKLHPTWRND
jgi:hypothetical protein